MAVPLNLKNFHLSIDGIGMLGVASEVELPEISIKTEEWRGGGMDTPIELDMGLEVLTANVTLGEYNASVLQLMGQVGFDDIDCTIRGGLRREKRATTPVECRMRGFWKKLELGTWKPGDMADNKWELSCSYFRYMQDNVTLIEIDCINMVRFIGGVDQMASMRVALGLSSRPLAAG